VIGRALTSGLLLGLLGATPLMAQPLPDVELPTLLRLVDSTCVDLTDRIGCERVMLLINQDDPATADLFILPDHRAHDATTPLLIVRKIAPNGSMFGMSPWLETADDGTLELHMEQIGIGRAPWTMALTLSWQDDAFLIDRFAYQRHDRLDLSSFQCEIDFRLNTYDATITAVQVGDVDALEHREQGDIPAQVLRLADWTAYDTPFPEPCARLDQSTLPE